MIQDITDFIFVEHLPEKADMIFIPGSPWPETCERAAKLWLNGYAPSILPAGKYGINEDKFTVPKCIWEKYPKEYQSEWEYMADILDRFGVNREAIFKEDESMYTYQNAFNSRQVTDELNLKIKTAIICCQAFHARRCLMYYQWAYPEVRFMVCPVETQGVNKNNWYKSANGIKRVMGELMRCGSQLVDAIPDYYQESINSML